MTAARDMVRQLAGFIANELGWKVDTADAYAEYPGVYLDGPAGARVYVKPDWRNPDRIELSGTYPDGTRDVYPSPEYVTIGVARDRGPAVMAREITRRLLPKYLPELERVTAAIGRNGEAAEARAAFMAELVDILPGGYAVSHMPDVVSWSANDGASYGQFRVNHAGTGASIDRCGVLSGDIVRKVAAILAAGGPDE